MNIEWLREHCLKKPGTTEGFPFDNDTLVFKVINKMYALTSLESPVSVNLKCDPEYSVELREQYEAVNPGWHMNKKHWNTVSFDQDLGDKQIFELVDHSYDMVVKSLKKADREQLKNLS